MYLAITSSFSVAPAAAASTVVVGLVCAVVDDGVASRSADVVVDSTGAELELLAGWSSEHEDSTIARTSAGRASTGAELVATQSHRDRPADPGG
jgi:hypothetical protein